SGLTSGRTASKDLAGNAEQGVRQAVAEQKSDQEICKARRTAHYDLAWSVRSTSCAASTWASSSSKSTPASSSAGRLLRRSVISGKNQTTTNAAAMNALAIAKVSPIAPDKTPLSASKNWSKVCAAEACTLLGNAARRPRSAALPSGESSPCSELASRLAGSKPKEDSPRI